VNALWTDHHGPWGDSVEPENLVLFSGFLRKGCCDEHCLHDDVFVMGTRSKDILARDTYLALLQAHEVLQAGAATLFKSHGLTAAQYNVLRILRGAGKDGLPCQMIGERLVNRVPDVTRLLDRMERDGLVVRERSEQDRRVVRARLVPAGRSKVDSLDDPVLELHRDQFKGINRSDLEALEAQLSTFRGS